MDSYPFEPRPFRTRLHSLAAGIALALYAATPALSSSRFNVEQVLRDTNNGGGFFGSTARNTSTMISVTDRYGNAAVFEIDGNSFTRDNITTTYAPDGSGNYSS